MVDAYSAWCGPCKAIVSSLKRLKNELGDDFLIFATVSIHIDNDNGAYAVYNCHGSLQTIRKQDCTSSG